MLNLLKKLFGMKTNDQPYTLPNEYKHVLAHDHSKYVSNRHQALPVINGKRVSFSANGNGGGNCKMSFTDKSYRGYVPSQNQPHDDDRDDYIGFFRPTTVGKSRAQQWADLGRSDF